MSNLLSRLVMQYNSCIWESERGLIREGDAVFELRYEYIFDPSYLLRAADGGGRVGRGQVLNWAVRDTVSTEVFWPEINDRAFLNSDYLLVTVVPNILDHRSFDKGETIVIFGGTHGPGTRAVSTLFTSEACLERLINRVGRMQYWQALLRVDAIHHNDKIDHPISLASEFPVYPIGINETRLKKWFEHLPVSPRGPGADGRREPLIEL